MEIINTAWHYWFLTFKPITDNIPILILLTTSCYVALISLVRFLLIKSRGPGPMDALYILAVRHMLKYLYLIHARIINILQYGVYIISSSDAYKESFYSYSGIKADNPKRIAFTIYNIRPEDWEDWTICQPHQLYYKMGKAFQHTRVFLDGYIDDRIILPLWGKVLLVTVIITVCAVCLLYERLTFVQAASVFLCTLPYILLERPMVGSALALVFLWFGEAVMHYFLKETKEIVNYPTRTMNNPSDGA